MTTTTATSPETKTTTSTSKSAVKSVPEGMHTVTPYLTCANAAEAIAFYTRAFGAAEMIRIPTPDGRIVHASLRIGDSVVMLSDEWPEMGALGPKARQGTSVTIHLMVDDVDAWFERATKAGATVKMPLADMFWGDRYGALEDPYGHSWSIATHQRDLTPDEIRAAAANACGGS